MSDEKIHKIGTSIKEIENMTARPKSAILLPTLGCNLHCRMCYHWQNKEEGLKRPDTKEWKDFIDSFQEVVNDEGKDGQFTIVFGGGEPLMFAEDVVDMVSFSVNKGYRTSLATNGYVLNTELVRRLISSGLHSIGLSLDSLDETMHDYLRGMRGSYKKVIEALECLKEFRKDVRIAINTIIMAPNLDGIIRLIDYVKEERHISSILFQAIIQPFHTRPQEDWRESFEYNFLWPRDIKAVRYIIDRLIEFKSREGFPEKIDNSISQLKAFKSYFENPHIFIKTLRCNVVESGFFTIGPDGNINVCPYMKSIGNIKEGSLKSIWYSEGAVKTREEMLNCRRNCHHLINCWYEEESNG